MESRLPKPKAGLKPPGTASTSNLETSNMKVPKPVSTSSLRDLGKSKSGVNITTRPTTKENKPPPKPTIERSKTLATISRSTAATTRTALKRPGPISTAVEPKKPAIRPTTRAVASSTTAGVSGKSLKPTATTKTLPTKVSKWDWKTKFEIANRDLTSLKEKHKEAADERDELQGIVDELRGREDVNAVKVETLQVTNSALSNELTSVKREINELVSLRDKQEIELNQLQESLDKALASSKNYETLCKAQEDQITEHSTKVRTLELNLESLKKTKNELTQKVNDLQNLVHQMDKDRRVLHNTIQEMKGNIRVFCRVRPKISRETGKSLCTINYADECTLEIGRADGSDSLSCSGKIRGTRQEFSFDKVFPPTASQAIVFEELSMLVQSALEGYNVCVFAYGQTGSGKTYTMEGANNPELEGMIPRTVRHIFEEMKEFELLGWEYKVEASFLEIYNEHIVDLLDATQKTHEIRMVDTKGSDLYVTNLQVEEIHSPEELHECLQMAQKNRAVAATKCNERSSRSHSVARIKLIGTHREKEERCVGNLNLVDLAGSERLKGEEVARNTETKNINKSLANLGNVILALLKKQEHIPYRNSKLTHLLMPSLGGNSKTLMLLNVSPLDDCYNETLNSLRFASNVNSCKTGSIKRTKTMLQNTSG